MQKEYDFFSKANSVKTTPTILNQLLCIAAVPTLILVYIFSMAYWSDIFNDHHEKKPSVLKVSTPYSKTEEGKKLLEFSQSFFDGSLSKFFINNGDKIQRDKNKQIYIDRISLGTKNIRTTEIIIPLKTDSTTKGTKVRLTFIKKNEKNNDQYLLSSVKIE